MTLDEANVISSIGRLEAGEVSLKEGITEIKRELSEMRREVRDDVSAIRNDLAGRGKMNWPLLVMAVGLTVTSLTMVERFMVTPLDRRCDYIVESVKRTDSDVENLKAEIVEIQSQLSTLMERTRVSSVPQKVFGDVQ